MTKLTSVNLVFLTVLLISVILVSPHTHGGESSKWVQIDRLGTDNDRALIRYGDYASLIHQEPWAIFDEHWRIFKEGKYSDAGYKASRVAINCLTGAWMGGNDDQTESEENLLKRVERRWHMHAINILHPREGLETNVLKFACHCNQSNARALQISEEEVEAIYKSQIVRQTSVEMVEVRTVMFKSERLANEALRVIDVDNRNLDNFKAADGAAIVPNDGYLGWNSIGSYDISTQRLLDDLRPGQIGGKALESLYGFNIFQLIARKNKKPAHINKWRLSIENYLENFNSCRKQ